jgi:hypothetical protein
MTPVALAFGPMTATELRVLGSGSALLIFLYITIPLTAANSASCWCANVLTFDALY